MKGNTIMIYMYITIGIVCTALIIAGILILIKKRKKPTNKIDQVPFNQLNWSCGGTNGSGALLSTVRISNLVVNKPKSLTINWDVGMADWGYSTTSADGIACLFCKVNGKWLGGKFEWISTSRQYRDLKNIREGYAQWKASYLNTSEFAFVVLNKSATKRSNVIYFKV